MNVAGQGVCVLHATAPETKRSLHVLGGSMIFIATRMF